jgi:hypothetical protein
VADLADQRLIQLEGVRRRLRKSEAPSDRRYADLALALQQGHFVYLLGAGFVGIAFQPFVYMLIALQIALVQQVRRKTTPVTVAQRKMQVPGNKAPMATGKPAGAN